jgi:hypothetical protein
MSFLKSIFIYSFEVFIFSSKMLKNVKGTFYLVIFKIFFFQLKMFCVFTFRTFLTKKNRFMHKK